MAVNVRLVVNLGRRGKAVREESRFGVALGTAVVHFLPQR